MKKPQPKPKAHHLVVERIDSTLPFSALAEVLEACLTGVSDGELFVDPCDGLVRVGGLRLRGDVLIRPEHPGEEHRLLVAFRQGDRARIGPLFTAMAAVWRNSDRKPSEQEGLALLNFLQGDSVIEHLRQVEVSSRAVEDAFGCRFDDLDKLRMRLVDLNGQAICPLDWIADDDSAPAYDPKSTEPLRVVLHRGKKEVLFLRERLESRGGRGLTLHLTLGLGRRAYLLGSLAE